MAAHSTSHGNRSGDRWFVAGYAGLAGFFVLEAVTRQGGRSSSLEPSSDDQATTRLIVLSYALVLLLAPLVRGLPQPQLPRLSRPVGLALEAAGLGLRAWSMRTLGRAYSRTLLVEDEHALIETGPYRFVRHPGYAGSILTWTGFALSSRSPSVVALVGASLGSAYQRRIAAEERLMLRDVPAYADYTARTRRPIPFVW